MNRIDPDQGDFGFIQGGFTDFSDIHEVQKDRFELSCNVVAVTGRIVNDVECFATRSGKPKISFRIAIPRTPDLPRKKPASSDFYTVNCYGPRFAPLLDVLYRECQVVVIGWVQSRDVDSPSGPRVVNEIGARAVIPILDSSLFSALEVLLKAFVRNLSPQDRRDLLEALANDEIPEIVPRGPEGLHPAIRQVLLRVLSREEPGGSRS